MEIGYEADGQVRVLRYEVGDLVRLRESETGGLAMGMIGDWGAVIAVEGGMSERFDIQVAGYSRPRTSGLRRLTGLTRRAVVPCNRQGIPIDLPALGGLRTLEAGLTRRVPAR